MMARSNPDPSALVARLTGPVDSGPGCDACFESLDRYVELQRAGADADGRVPGMREHLGACAACADDARSLHALLDADDAGAG
jgi:hypothetical protein